MQTTHLLYHLVARTHMKMIRIRQFHLGSDSFQIFCGYRTFNSCSRSHIHKYRGLNYTMYGMEFSPFGITVFVYQFIHALFHLQ